MSKLQFTPEDFFASAHDMQMSAGLSESPHPNGCNRKGDEVKRPMRTAVYDDFYNEVDMLRDYLNRIVLNAQGDLESDLTKKEKEMENTFAHFMQLVGDLTP